MRDDAEKYHLKVHFPPLEYCTDNAAMIARAGYEYLVRNRFSDLDLNAYPALTLNQKN